MLYPTNEQMPEQLELPPVRKWSFLQRLRGDHLAVMDAEASLNDAVATRRIRALEQLTATLVDRCDNLETLCIQQGELLHLHHEAMKRWVAESATIRDIEERAEKKRRRRIEAEEAAAKAKSPVPQDPDATVENAPEQTVFDGEDGG